MNCDTLSGAQPCVAAIGAPRVRTVAPPTHDARPRRRWGTVLGTGAALGLLLAPVAVPFRLLLIWNVSASVPVGLYRLVPFTAPRAGDLVAVRPSAGLTSFMAARRYVEAGALLVKPIAAIEGQRVCRWGVNVTLDGVAVATALVADHMRRPLPVWTGCRRLRRGEVFLLVPGVPASFDRRYFGPVSAATIVGRAVPLCSLLP